MNPVKSKVKSVQASGTWESSYGVMYSFDYEFEDGVVMQANHKTQDGNFKVGEEVEYTIKRENEYGKSGNVSKFQNDAHKAHATNTYEKKYRLNKCSNASFALSYAKDLVIPLASAYSQDVDTLTDDVLKVAERFNLWLNNN